MNDLSWLFYGMDMLFSLKTFLEVIGFFSTAACVVYIIIWSHLDESCVKENNLSSPFKWIFVPIGLFLLSIFIPSKDTMKLIAASEIGERVVKSERVSGIVDPSLDIMKNKLILFNRELEKQINGETSKK